MFVTSDKKDPFSCFCTHVNFWLDKNSFEETFIKNIFQDKEYLSYPTREGFLQEKMPLTAQMHIELKAFLSRADHIYKQILHPMAIQINQLSDPISIPHEIIENTQTIFAELNGHKTRIENILCETDIKEQAHEDLLQSWANCCQLLVPKSKDRPWLFLGRSLF